MSCFSLAGERMRVHADMGLSRRACALRDLHASLCAFPCEHIFALVQLDLRAMVQLDCVHGSHLFYRYMSRHACLCEQCVAAVMDSRVGGDSLCILCRTMIERFEVCRVAIACTLSHRRQIASLMWRTVKFSPFATFAPNADTNNPKQVGDFTTTFNALPHVSLRSSLSLSRSLFSNISGQGKRDLGSSRKDTGNEDAGNAVSAKSGIDSLHSRGRRNQRRHSDGEADDSNTGGRDDLEAATGDCKWGRDNGSNNAAGVETIQVQASFPPQPPLVLFLCPSLIFFAQQWRQTTAVAESLPLAPRRHYEPHSRYYESQNALTPRMRVDYNPSPVSDPYGSGTDITSDTDSPPGLDLGSDQALLTNLSAGTVQRTSSRPGFSATHPWPRAGPGHDSGDADRSAQRPSGACLPPPVTSGPRALPLLHVLSVPFAVSADHLHTHTCASNRGTKNAAATKSWRGLGSLLQEGRWR